MKILVISLAGIGDTLFATPLIHELRANFPEAQLDALVMWQGSKDLLEGNPHLNAVYQKNLIKCATTEALQFLWPLRKTRYDFSINTHPQSRVHYRAVARFVGAKVRVSHRYDHHSVIDRLLVNRSLPQDYQRHSVENNLALLGFLSGQPLLKTHEYEIYLSAAEQSWAEDFVKSKHLHGRQLLGIHVGSGGTKNLALRRWPLARYAELITRLNHGQPELAVVLFGGPEEEKDHAQLLAQANPARVFHPQTRNFRQAAALVKKCDMFLSVDTVLMHIAAAMKVPKQIVIETPTWNKPIEPYGNPFVLVKNPAVKGKNLDFYRYDGRGIQGTDEELAHCMESVTVEAVLQTILS